MVTTASLLPKSGAVTKTEVDDWVEHWKSHQTLDESREFQRAVDLMLAHYGEARLDNGNWHLLSLLQTADILGKLKMDAATVIAALLSDLPLEDDFQEQQLEADFSAEVITLVLGVARISQLSGETALGNERQDENLRRMLLSFSSDVRVILLVLAKRLQLMRLLSNLPEAEQTTIANETQRIYGPLANRLGIWQIKWELEDLALRYGQADDYRRIVDSLEEKRHEREAFIGSVVVRLREACKKLSIKNKINGRPKHIYSIWRKMQRKGVDFDQIFDVRALRVLVDSVGHCYEVLGLVHGMWQPIPGEFDDYVSRPKSNGYRSLHTAVIGEDGKPLEIQIRTYDMHEHSERGVAAHWRYKESTGQDNELERHIEWMRDWLENKGSIDLDLSSDAEFEAKRIYALTPLGKVVELPNGATAIDFAYAIHTSVGHRCRGAKADNRIISLTTPLKSGQVVEIMTAKEGSPSRDWLNSNMHYAVTSRARDRIRQWFKHQDYEQHIQIGRASLDREIKRLSIKKPNLDKLAPEFKCKSADELCAAIGRGDFSASQVAQNYAVSLKAPETETEEVLTQTKSVRKNKDKKTSQVTVHGVDDLLTSMARCCKPVPYDEIVGYITKGRGITVHRHDCSVVKRMSEEQQQRLIAVAWQDEIEQDYLVDIQVYAADRKGLLKDISAVFSNEEVSVLGVTTHSDKHRQYANMRFSVEIAGLRQLSQLLEKLHQVPDVIDAYRQI